MKTYLRWVNRALAVMCVAAAALVLFVAGRGISRDADIHALSDNWLISGERAELPVRLKKGELELSRELTLSETAEGVIYFATNYQRVRAFLNGEALPVEGLNGDSVFGVTNDLPWSVISLPEGARGELTIKLNGEGSKLRAEVYAAYSGDESDIRLKLLGDALPMLVVALTLGIMGLVLCVFGCSNLWRGTMEAFSRLMLLALFSLLSAAWIATDTSVQGAFYIGSEAYFLTNLFSYMLMPLPFLLLVRGEGAVGRRAINISAGLVIIEIVINATLMVLGGYRLYNALTLSHVVLSLAIGFALLQCVFDNMRDHSPGARRALISLSVLGLTGLGAIIQFYIAPSSDNTLLFRFGIMAFIALLGVDAIRGSADMRARAAHYERLRVSEEEYRIAAEQSAKMIFRYDIGARTLHSQPSAAAEFAIPETLKNVPANSSMRDSISPDTLADYIRFYEGIITGHDSGSGAIKLKRADGQWRWYHADFSSIKSKSGAPFHAIISMQDVTELREKEMAYEKWRQDYDALPRASIKYYEYNISNDTFDREEGELFPAIDPGVPRTLSAMAMHIAENYVALEDFRKFLDFYSRERLLARYYSGERVESLLFRARRAQGDSFWTRATAQLIPDPYSNDVKGFILLQDVDAEIKAAQESETRKNYDFLTMLLNRGAFIERIEALLEETSDSRHAILMIDVDLFKQINDLLGHHMGDRALRYIADKLRALLGEDALIGRIGGDEFVACVSDIGADNAEIGQKMCDICAALKTAGGAEMNISGSIGVSIFPDDARTFEQLYQNADKALYRAKREGRSQFRFYSKEIDAHAPGVFGTPIDSGGGI